MKTILLSTVALVGLAGVASAADLPRRAYVPVAPLAPAFTWTGFYIGVNAGAAFDASDDEDNLGSIRLPRGSVRNSSTTDGTLTFNNDVVGGDDGDVGFSGGGQIGFNYQFTPGQGFVIGVEADIQYIDLGGDDDDDGDFNAGIGTARFTGVPGQAFAPPAATIIRNRREQGVDLDYFGTVRGRVGYAFDRTLVYATGGFAYGNGGGNENNGFFDEGVSDDEDEFKFGYAVGGGVEFALSNFGFGSSAATFKIEGLYVNLENDDTNAGRYRAAYNPLNNTLRVNENQVKRETEFAVVRAGVNFKF